MNEPRNRSSKAGESTTPPATPLAIVGIACRFPKANDLNDYWVNVRDGVDAISDIPATHWSHGEYFASDPKTPDHTYGTRGGFLSPLDFDPLEFGIAPNAIEATDTAQLLAMVAARDALIDAGIGDTGKPAKDGELRKPVDRDRVSVILGVTGTLELVIPLGARLGHPLWRRALEDAGVDPQTADDVVARISDGYVDWQEASFPGLLGNVVAGRVANRLDLGGTNCVVDAACASSLSALHLAALELESGRSDVVVTGGVDTFNDIFMYMCFSKTPALSPSGHARPFAKDCDGTTLGEGVGIVVLKRLEDAERDGDRIYSVVRGLGSSSDGKGNAIYAPNSDGQAKALRRAYENAGITADTIELVEAHGTGTAVGDATEVRGLSKVYREAKSDGEWCALGSVKSQIGHTKAAAGIAGLIKTSLALHHEVLPPTIKVEQPLEELTPGQSPFYLNTSKRPWLRHPDHPRRAALSAFGFGGSNFHCVLEEAVHADHPTSFDGTVELVALSDVSADRLRARVLEWQKAREWSWQELRARAALARREFKADAPCRIVLPIERDTTNIATLVRGAAAMLQSRGDAEFWTTPEGVAYGSGRSTRRLGFVFPGQGAQYPDMLKDLACSFPTFRGALEAGDVAYWNGDGPDSAIEEDRAPRLSDAIYPRPVFRDDARSDQTRFLRSTQRAQPAIGAVSAGALAVLRKFGLEAEAFAGHSFGELTALHAAGRLSETDFHQLANFRGRLMAAGRGDRGSMIAIQGTEDEALAMVRREGLDLVVANKNTPRQTVLSGATFDIDRAAEACEKSGLRARKLTVSAAFHSKFVADAETPFREILDKVRFADADKPVYANSSAAPYPKKTKDVRAMLAGQLARPVEFVEMIRRMQRDGISTFIEVGPGSKVTGMVRAIVESESRSDGDAVPRFFALDASQGKRSGVADLARLLASVAALGHGVDLSQWAPEIESYDESKTPKRPRFTVPLTGANYRQKRPSRPRSTAESARPPSAVAGHTPTEQRGAASPKRSTAITPHHATAETVSSTPRTPAPLFASGDPSPTAASHPVPSTMTMTAKETTVNPKPAPNASPDAARMLNDGLQALRELQSETAELHRQFLDGQRRAQDSFVRLVEEQQRLAHGLAPSPRPSELVGHAPATATQPAPAPVTQAPIAPTSPAPVVPQPEPTPAAIESRMTPSAPPSPGNRLAGVFAMEDSAPSGTVAPAVDADTVLEIVAEKTGYPTEMLELDMELEADLGIDSIKRVEILSAVQERIPSVRSVAADELGQLVSLRDVVGILGRPLDSSAAPATPAAPAPANSVLIDTLIEVVAEKTGYPTEMLELDMELEADLGIDSIKRVEILSAVQERLPDAPTVSAEHLGTLSTLREITEFLGADAAAVSTSPVASPVVVVPSEASDLSVTLLDVVAEKTGYPTEMLSLEMELEADLGIDSIKRVEILSAVQERRPDLPSVDAEQLGQLRTLASVLEHFAAATAPAATAPAATAPAATTPAAATPATSAPAVATPAAAVTGSERTPRPFDAAAVESSAVTDVQRWIPTLVEAVPSTELLPGVRSILLVGPDETIRSCLATELEGRGLTVTTAEAAKVESVTSDGVILLASEGHDEMRAALAVASLCRNDDHSLILFATVSRQGGSFGLDGSGTNAIQGGWAGLAKTARREWDDVSCRAFDVPVSASAKIATMLVDELLSGGPAELGIDPSGQRWTIELTRDTATTTRKLPIDKGDTVLVTGGARGVTASACLALARAARPHFVLLGRSAAPGDEPAFLAEAVTDADIKRVLLANTDDEKVTPRKLARRTQRILRDREMRATFDQLQQAGATVEYAAVDVQSVDAVAELVTRLRTRGPIRGFVHGAGVLRDHHIAGKSIEDFDAVYGTKVGGSFAVLSALDLEELRVCAFFSSTTARLGRVGQVDYAMANEVLNKVAHCIRRDHPKTRVVSFGWGPWDGGMVTPSLRTVFESEGVGLIPLEGGAEFFVDELSRADGPVEVVVMGPTPTPGSSGPPPGESHDAPATRPRAKLSAHDASMRVVQHIELDTQSHPYLLDHQLDGKPVLPAAFMAEWSAHTASHANPGLRFLGFEDFRVLRGLQLDGSAVVSIAVGKMERREHDYAVPCEVRAISDVSNGEPVVALHSRCTVLLSEPNSSVEAPTRAPAITGDPCDSNVYDEILFHGPRFRAIASVPHCSAEGIVATHETGGSPAEWSDVTLRNEWLTDPLSLDVGFQAMIVWSQQVRGARSLPSGFARYRQFLDFPSTAVTLTATVRDASDHAAHADLEWVDADGQVIARMEGYECTIDARLAKAFAPSKQSE